VRQMRLTDISIRALKTPAKGAVVVPDDQVPGFGVRVSEGGTKSFVLTHGIRRQRETIGRLGVVTLQEARAEVKRRLAEYTLGKNKPRSKTWDAARDEYLAVVAAKCKARTHRDYRYHLTRTFRYGRTQIYDVTPEDLQKSLDKLADAPGVRRYSFVVLRSFMRWAHRKQYVATNPVMRIDVPSKCASRERVLTDDELKRVWLSAGDDTFGRIVKLLVLTGQRRSEITELKGGMVGNETIIFPSAHTKNSRQHIFPIGPMAVEIIGGPYKRNENVFPALGKTTPFNGHSPCKRRLDKRCGVEEWTLHDLRRTFATGLASLGVQIPVIERLLNHISGSFGGIVGIYQRYDFMPEMRAAISKWETYVRQLVNR
jgi:integrase